jgi:hypothetical protein
MPDQLDDPVVIEKIGLTTALGYHDEHNYGGCELPWYVLWHTLLSYLFFETTLFSITNQLPLAFSYPDDHNNSGGSINSCNNSGTPHSPTTLGTPLSPAIHGTPLSSTILGTLLPPTILSTPHSPTTLSTLLSPTIFGTPPHYPSTLKKSWHVTDFSVLFLRGSKQFPHHPHSFHVWAIDKCFILMIVEVKRFHAHLARTGAEHQLQLSLVLTSITDQAAHLFSCFGQDEVITITVVAIQGVSLLACEVAAG